MRVACVLIHNFAVQVAVTHDPQLRRRPLIIGGSPFEAKPVYDASPEAAACGVEPGMPLRRAYALCPEARFLPSDEKGYRELFEQVIAILDGFSPVVEVEGLGCAYLDIAGVDSEHDLAHEIRGSIFLPTRLNACLGISSNKFLSRTAAFVTNAQAPLIVPQGEEREFIAPFSITLLPCSAETKRRLYLLGIRTIGQLSRFSREALQVQFGSDGAIAYGLARGIDDIPLIPRKKPDVISDAAEFDPPLVASHQLAQASEVMLDRLLALTKGKVCHQIKLQLGFPSGSFRERKLPLKEATPSKSVIMSRMMAWLGELSLPEPVSRMDLSLDLAWEQGKKLHLFPQRGGRRGEVNCRSADSSLLTFRRVGMARLSPEEIKVSSDTRGMPLSLTRNRKRERITGIYEHWRIADEWWDREIQRDYFRIETSEGVVLDIYHDMAANLWYLDRMHAR